MWLLGWEGVYVQCALFVFVCACLCVVELYEMEKAVMSLHKVGVVVQRKMSRGFPRTVCTFDAAGCLKR